MARQPKAKSGKSAKEKKSAKAVEAELVTPLPAVETASAPAPSSISVRPTHSPSSSPSSSSTSASTGLPSLPIDLSDLDIDSKGRDPVAQYLAEIRRYPLLTREQEQELAILYYEKKDQRAAELLVTSNLRFVVKIASEYAKFGARLIDLIQEGNVGLLHGVREFNPYKGVRLITYAVWWIRGYIQEYLLREYSMVRIATTQNQRKLFYRLQKEKEYLDSLGQSPTVPLLSSRLGVSEEDVHLMTQRLSARDVSLNQPMDADAGAGGSSVSSGGGGTGNQKTLLDMEESGDIPADELIGEHQELSLLRENIEKLRPHLNQKESYLLENRLLADEPLTLQEVGDHFGVTREAMRQVEARLLEKLRQKYVESSLPPATKTSAKKT